jgi:hypothetical protein
MRPLIPVAAVLAAVSCVAAGCAQTTASSSPTASSTAAPTAVPAGKTYTTAETPIGDLLADPAAKAVLDKDLPGFSSNPNIGKASSMTLRQLQPFAHDKITDQVLSEIDADFAKLPPK